MRGKRNKQKGELTLFNADAEIAVNYLKFEDAYLDDLHTDYSSDDFYGSYDDNMKDIKTHFGDS